MKIWMAACSRRAYDLMQDLKQKWKKEEPDLEIVEKVKCSSMPEISEKSSLSECVGEWFEWADAIVFFCAAGIAVRTIAPCISHKSKDPAVVVIDETGKFAISLLSGHAGGANELTERISAMIGAVPVITTATDRRKKFAVDDFARKNCLKISDWKMAKKVSVEILDGKKIGIFSELPLKGKLPKELFIYEEDFLEKQENMVILISKKKDQESFSGRFLQLIPQNVLVGIGCRKGISKEKIEKAVDQCLKEENILQEAVEAVVTIDLKKNEAGLIDFCKERNWDFHFYSSGQLKELKGNFSESAFVKKITGVDNVCERSVVAAGGTLICKKKIYDGVTVALAEKKRSIKF